MAVCIFCLQLISEDEKATTLTQKGLEGILKANAFKERKIFPYVGDKVKVNS